LIDLAICKIYYLQPYWTIAYAMRLQIIKLGTKIRNRFRVNFSKLDFETNVSS